MTFRTGKVLNSVFWLILAASAFMLTACGSGKTQGESPVAVIDAGGARGVAPYKATFRSIGSSTPKGKITSYKWHFPDGSTQESTNASYTFAAVGDYTVDLTVENDSGLSDTASVAITVLEDDKHFSIKGRVTSLPYTDIDGDINDPNAPHSINNGATESEIQQLNNPINLNGFASKSPTQNPGDRFEKEADEEDHFRVKLNEKDFVSVIIADYEKSDLDLYLYKEPNMELVTSSTSSTEFESLQVEEAGSYIVVVEAVQGYTNYVLKIGRSSFSKGLAAKGQSTDFEDSQVVLRLNKNKTRSLALQSYTDRAQLRTSHRNKNRAMLAHINPLNPQTHNMLWGRVEQRGFSQRLASINPGSARKLKTIKAIKHLRQQADIAYAEPNYRVQSLLTPRDTLFKYQWHLTRLNMQKTWDITTGDSDVIIAVIDSGVYPNHPDLKNQLVAGYDFVSDPTDANDGDGIDPDPTDPGDKESIESSSWHGTHVTGVAVGEMGNDLGIVGIAPNSKVMPVRALGLDGGLIYDVLQAIRYASGLENDSGTVPQKAVDVMNLSFGGGSFSLATQELFNQVREQGVIVVASAGNQNTGEAMYPASYSGVVSVGAAAPSGERADYSNTGTNLDVLGYGGNLKSDTDNDEFPDGILSTMIFEENGEADPGYSFLDGTSMAAPQISAIAALMKSVYPELTPDLFDSLLYSGALTVDKGLPGRDNEYGYGLIDGLKAINAAQDLQGGGVTSAITSDSSTLLFDQATSSLSLNIEPIGNTDISVTNVVVSEPWVSISEKNVSSGGLGVYTVSIPDDAFESGVHIAQVLFETDSEATLTVEVIVRVGVSELVGNAGYLYILLVNADTDKLYQTIEMESEEGVYDYHFQNVPINNYYITAGSDVDNNTIICDHGETCGSYPEVTGFEVFHLLEDRSGMDFTAGLYNNLNLLNMHSLFNTRYRVKRN